MSEMLFTLEELRNAFIAGGLFEKNTIDVDSGYEDELTELDFGEYVKEVYDIII